MIYRDVFNFWPSVMLERCVIALGIVVIVAVLFFLK